MTCFNAEETIANALKSAFKQSWPNKEIIVVDDHSSDQSNTIISKTFLNFSCPCHHVKLSENLGVGGAINKGLKHAQGKYIAIFDDDDTSISQRIEIQYEYLKKQEVRLKSNLIICQALRKRIHHNGIEIIAKQMGLPPSFPSGSDLVEHNLIGRPLKKSGGFFANSANFMRFETLKRIGGYDSFLRRAEDNDLVIRLGLQGGYVVAVPKVLIHQKITYSADKNIDQYRKAEFYIIEKYKNYLQTKNLYRHCLAWLDFKYAFLGKKNFYLKLFKLFLIHPVSTFRKLFWASKNLAYNLKLKKHYNSHLMKKYDEIVRQY